MLTIYLYKHNVYINNMCIYKNYNLCTCNRLVCICNVYVDYILCTYVHIGAYTFIYVMHIIAQGCSHWLLKPYTIWSLYIHVIVYFMVHKTYLDFQRVNTM